MVTGLFEHTSYFLLCLSFVTLWLSSSFEGCDVKCMASMHAVAGRYHKSWTACDLDDERNP